MRCRRVVSAVSAISCGSAVLLAVSPALAESRQAPHQQQKILHTIPEDGADAELVAPDELVRSLMTSRPQEDLVICVGGCSSDHDRVVYAQPALPAPPVVAAPAASSEPQGSMLPTAVPPSEAPAVTAEPTPVEPEPAQPSPSSDRTSAAPGVSDGVSLPSLPEGAPEDGGAEPPQSVDDGPPATE